jgi:hypothetical protein
MNRTELSVGSRLLVCAKGSCLQGPSEAPALDEEEFSPESALATALAREQQWGHAPSHQCGGDQQDGDLLPVPAALNAPKTGSNAGSSPPVNAMNKPDGGGFQHISRSFQRLQVACGKREAAAGARRSGCEWELSW